MVDDSENLIKRVISGDAINMLTSGKFGIEKESLRV